MISPKPNNIDEYISMFPDDIQKKLEQVRLTIKKASPEAKEKISYGIPTFFLNGNLVHFAGYKNHIGFYPASSGIKAFQNEISQFKNSKGTVQFPLDKKLPLKLITEIVKFRVKENFERRKSKQN